MKYIFCWLIFLFCCSNVISQNQDPNNLKGIKTISNYDNSGYFRKQFYNLDGKLVKKEFYNNQRNLMTEFLFEYNIYGYLISAKRIYHIENHTSNVGIDDIHDQYMYEYTKDGNIKKQYSIHQYTDTTIITLQGIENEIFHYKKIVKGKESDWWVKYDHNRKLVYSKNYSEKSDSYLTTYSKYDKNGFLLEAITKDSRGNITHETKYAYKYNRRGFPKKVYRIINGKKEFSHRAKYKFYK